MNRFSFFLVGLASMLWAAACGDSPSACDCFLCERAMSVAVFDSSTGVPVEDFVLEYVLNGEARGEPVCDEFLEETNTCTFGDAPGLYHIVVRAPGYADRELVARVGLEDNSNRCCSSCVREREVEVSLDPR